MDDARAIELRESLRVFSDKRGIFQFRLDSSTDSVLAECWITEGGEDYTSGASFALDYINTQTSLIHFGMMMGQCISDAVREYEKSTSRTS